MTPRRDRLMFILMLAAVYIAAGRLGLGLDAVSGFATLVWPPSGISLALLLLLGNHLWPGVAIGAFVVNVWAGASIPLALGIATGNTLEAVVAVYLIRRIPGFTPALQRLRDVLAIILCGAVLSTMLSATVGTTSLLLANVISADRFGMTWLAWWIGDAVADVIIVPLMLSCVALRHSRLDGRRISEAIVIALFIVITSALVFATEMPRNPFSFLQPYLLSPVLIWAALRFRLAGASTSIFLVSAIAIWGTAASLGPFTGGPLYQRLGALQAFMSIMALTFLILGAVSEERAYAERQLRVARDAAEAASRAKSRFLAVVSHELRTPLSGIVGYCDLLLESIGGPMTEKQTTFVSRIRSAGWHLGGIIDGILTFSRGEANRDALHIEDVDGVALIRDTLTFLMPQAATRGLDIQLTSSHLEVAMRTDPGKLRQIVVNLVGNAIKFSEQGTIEVELRSDGEHIDLDVSDHGPGIPTDQFERIFEPFTQLGADSAQLPGGTGLGLAVTRMLAVSLGGSVSVESELGVGSKFRVRLPVSCGE